MQALTRGRRILNREAGRQPHGTPPCLGSRRGRCLRPAGPAGPRGVAPARAALHEPGAARAHVAGDGARERSLPAPDRDQSGPLAEPRPLLCDVSTGDPTDPGRFGAREGSENGAAAYREWRWTRSLSVRADPSLVALDDAPRLRSVPPAQEWVVELRYFGGLSIEETSEALHISPDTVKRDWQFAKLWLLRELSGERPDAQRL